MLYVYLEALCVVRVCFLLRCRLGVDWGDGQVGAREQRAHYVRGVRHVVRDGDGCGREWGGTDGEFGCVSCVLCGRIDVVAERWWTLFVCPPLCSCLSTTTPRARARTCRVCLTSLRPWCSLCPQQRAGRCE